MTFGIWNIQKYPKTIAATIKPATYIQCGLSIFHASVEISFGNTQKSPIRIKTACRGMSTIPSEIADILRRNKGLTPNENIITIFVIKNKKTKILNCVDHFNLLNVGTQILMESESNLGHPAK